MSFSKLYALQLHALEPCAVDVEVDISRGLNSFSIVGLPDKAVEEAKDRISAAIKNSGFDSPKSKNHRIIISLAPAELRKEGSNFDLAMALAYLLAVGEVKFEPRGKTFLGELSLDGTLRSARGVLPLVIAAKQMGFEEIYVPFQNKDEAAIVEGIRIFAARSLQEVLNHLEAKKENSPQRIPLLQPRILKAVESEAEIDFREVKGQEGAKRALEIAAAGRHNIMLYGPPGTGKTMLARAFASILPPLTFEEVLQVTSIHSSVGLTQDAVLHPPFRAPHHSATHAAIVGGGSYPRPGEVTLAHKGVLFMDEFPEFDLRVIDSLRQPMEDKKVRISRARNSAVFPSDFILLASMNPCPCGFRGSAIKRCICSHAMIERYQRKISGPIIDRIDMWVEVSEIDYRKLGAEGDGELSSMVRERVNKARLVHSAIALSPQCRELINASAKSLHVSARGYHKVIKLSRTIADLEASEHIEERHILEALQYRPKY